METFYASGVVHSKHRHGQNGFYQNSTCGQNLRQTDYNFIQATRRSALLWRDYPNHGSEKRRDRTCTVALAVSSFFVMMAVFGVAGLAVYMNTLQSENTLVSYRCSAKILRGDRFVGNLTEKAKRYNAQLEALYKRSTVGAALMSCSVESFGNDTLTVHFRLTFNKKKLPKSSFGLEKTLRDALLNDVISKRPIFRNVRFDPKNITIKKALDNTQTHQRNKPKEYPKTKDSKQNNTKIPKQDIASVAQGSFTISKTDADITEKRNSPEIHSTQRPTKKYTSKASTVTETTTTTTTTSATSRSYTKADSFDNAPWVPIKPSSDLFTAPSISTSNPLFINKQPTYTSFTNPGLSFHLTDTEILGVVGVKSHPLPVNKISDITETPSIQVFTESTSSSGNSSVETPTTFIEVETVQYIPNPPIKSVHTNDNPSNAQVLKNISLIFHSLASSLGIASSTEESVRNTTEISEEPTVGHGQAEVINGDEESLIVQTSKVPLITLLPVKSNSGIAGPLRPRPKPNEQEIIENRSFPSEPFYNNLGSSSSSVWIPQTEVITEHRNKVLEHKVIGFVNFARESSKTEAPSTEIMSKKRETNEGRDSFAMPEKRNLLTNDELTRLAEISKLQRNDTNDKGVHVISTKAISSSYNLNHGAFKLLTKTFNKIESFVKDEEKKLLINEFNNTLAANKTAECNSYTITCGDGQCLPATTRCNQLIECQDASDEKGCECADYLRSQFLLRKICDGIVDCWDFSDENRCEWCQIDQYVCGNSKVCIHREKICDGIRDCPQGDDERQCVTIAPTLKAADEFPYNTEGYLMVRKKGQWGKLCLENFDNAVQGSRSHWEIADLGRAVCKALTYQNVTYIQRIQENGRAVQNAKYYKLMFKNESRTGLIFKEATCKDSEAVKVKCQSLECGARPQAVKHIARIVGGGNAALGAWPWQAALYKEGEFQCGATLLSDRWLLSAGHCFFHSLEEHWVARLGALRRGTILPSPYEQLRSIVRIVIHPGYVDAGFVNDISLLQMDSPTIFSDYVRPICLPQSKTTPADGALCTVVGWGQLFEAGRIFPDTLQEVQVPVISTAECRKRTIFLPLYSVTDDMFCAGFERGGRDACLGDSGGPLMCPESDGRWVLHGVTSNGYGCARANRPGVYTKVANYISWIRLHMDYDSEDALNATSRSTCQGHRCPLGECLPKTGLCNGFIECSDGSDEKDCV